MSNYRSHKEYVDAYRKRLTDRGYVRMDAWMTRDVRERISALAIVKGVTMGEYLTHLAIEHTPDIRDYMDHAHETETTDSPPQKIENPL